ncbi:MAG TPA: alkaline phosphatase family protein [Isosphaeraceae bacterium]|nr:alkaline phosphatase family protein [Isosphaeraceae bacterium]
MMLNATRAWAGVVLIVLALAADSARAQDPSRFAGPTAGGFLLPNGWMISPAGAQVTLADMPLNILPLAGGRHALVATSGYNSHNLALVDLAERKVVDAETVRESWFGLALDPKEGTLWWSGGGSKAIHKFRLAGQSLEPAAKDSSAKPDETRSAGRANPHPFKSGLTFDAAHRVLYSLDIEEGTITAIDPKGEKHETMAKIGARPYDVAIARNGSLLYVTDWAASRLLVVNPADLKVVSKIVVGEHPNQIALHPRDDRIFVACASSDSVAVIDTVRGIVTETIKTSLFPRAPEGSTPDAVAVAPDGNTLYVANADNNCVAVVDIAMPGQSHVKGFIPTGWYPSAVAVSADGKNLLVGVGKGNQSRPNPIEPQPASAAAAGGNGQGQDAAPKRRNRPFPYIGTLLSGALSIVPVPSERELAVYTDTVYKNCPYSDRLLTGAEYPHKTAIPARVGEPSPIKYIIYIIKENRTYDQVFGDMPQGNGDSALVMFGEEITPNHHKLAREFVLLDNLYCNGHVSADGHPWSTMAYNTDYIARNWALTYSGRAGVNDDDEGNLSKAPSGYLWDACARAGLSYRSYGEYGRRISQPDGSFRMEGAVPGLVGHFCPNWGAPRKDGKRVRDTDRVATFLEEFESYVEKGELPRFMVMSLGEDHTTGTKPGTFTPQACVASNDLALGQLVEGVSKSKVWKETAIFVIEDDAQNGPDHVDAHRTVGLLISPYVKRHSLDSTQYSTVSMLRSIELALGLPPLSQYDAAARPMFASFTEKADTAPFSHERARIDLDAENSPLAYGAERSSRMDFSEYDRIDDFELNEILWRAVKGQAAPTPPAVRRAITFRPVAQEP